MGINKRKSVYRGSGVDGDFGWMIKQSQFADSLFIFNDNESQFLAFHEGRPSGLSAGGGNAVIRPYQGSTPQRAAGIPTGDGGGYSALTPHVQQIIDRAIRHIEALVDSGNYQELVFSYDSKQNTLGTGIFNPHESVKKYIFDALMRL